MFICVYKNVTVKNYHYGVFTWTYNEGFGEPERKVRKNSWRDLRQL